MSSKLEQLLARLCPNGVEFMPLLEVADVLYGFPCDASLFNADGKGMPLVRIRDVPVGRTSTYTTEAVSEEYFISSGDLLVGMDGNFHVAVWKSRSGVLCQRVCRISSKNQKLLLNGFLAHILGPIIKKIEDGKNSGTVKHLLARDLASIRLPVPPLEVQNEIVRILDKFTELTAELTAELTTRRKQYEYYRDLLLSFDNRDQGGVRDDNAW